MAYWIRVFCTSNRPPSRTEIEAWAKTRADQLTIELPRTVSASWAELDICALPWGVPFRAEFTGGNDASSPLLRSEIDEFREMIVATKSPAKAEVLDHLDRTRFIVAIEIPTAEFRSRDFDAVDEFSSFLADDCGGMVQADGEGFYKNRELILPLR